MGVILNFFVPGILQTTFPEEKPLEVLKNGMMVEITEYGIYEIFFEDSTIPTLISYKFTFTNTENQNIIYSYTSDKPSYAYERKIKNREGIKALDKTVFGRSVALVELEAGRYIVRYPKWTKSGNFVW